VCLTTQPPEAGAGAGRGEVSGCLALLHSRGSFKLNEYREPFIFFIH
jgi:hypothetical protein